MSLHEDFDGLKRHLEDLGYNDAGLANRLRAELVSGTGHFTVRHREDNHPLTLVCFFNISRDREDGPFKLDDYDTLLVKNDDLILATRSFTGEIGKNEVREVLAKDAIYPPEDTDTSLWVLNRKGVKEYLHEGAPSQIDYWKRLNGNNMNEQNLDFLNNSVKYLGFEEKTAAVMDTKIRQGIPEFQVTAQHDHFNNSVFHTLHFKKSNDTDMYFFNKYNATLSNGKPEEDRSQTFYIKNGQGFTAKEAFNLLEGRAVYKELKNKDGQPYTAWSKLELDKEKDKNNNYPVRQFSAGWGYDLEKSVSRFPIQELHDADQKAALLRSLQKGNQQQVTIEKDGKQEKFYLEAVPALRTINIYDAQRREVKRDTLLKPELKVNKGKKQDNDQSQSEDQKQGKRRGRGKGI